VARCVRVTALQEVKEAGLFLASGLSKMIYATSVAGSIQAVGMMAMITMEER
jgi:hypothetical protein